MRTARRLGFAILLTLILLSQGCGSSKDIQNMAYVTAIGIDYVNGKYVTYAQILNFSNVARSENVQLGKETPVWIGQGDGQTVSGALASINETSQLRLFWGHVKVIFLSENLMRQGVVETFSALNRYREVRYNIYIYGTKEKMTDILSQQSLLNLSPLDTLVFSGTQMNSQRFFILPEPGNHVIANMNEPGEPAMLPSVAIERRNWMEDTDYKPMFKISGAYFFQDGKMSKWMSDLDLKGIRWTNKRIEWLPVLVPQDGKKAAVVSLGHPRYSVKPILEKGSVRYDLKVRVQGLLYELLEEAGMESLEKLTEEVIREEIRTTYLKSQKAKCDPFRLKEALYRANPRHFWALTDKERFFLKPDSIRKIDVRVSIRSTGKYKGRTE
ncbi:Ger(x)C family spore germination protein [Cohnella thailandensis]|uniref:Ger(X)C family spore germination protein n=1 Tax=Cohnella thailandensis TaxID=557557 RepID=A0A841T094_9BACL|nr:Ger(x)C family spore germination protein [Cohnella thailandensis]MBB6636952.1 Ger(x)C family spore germination protein [Cohnella thailandensis]MBP1973165.1 Ger(x)C family germination protein [Cohnella thailandensis]